MKKIISSQLTIFLMIGVIIMIASFMMKWVILFIGTFLICLIGFLVYELIGT